MDAIFIRGRLVNELMSLLITSLVGGKLLIEVEDVAGIAEVRRRIGEASHVLVLGGAMRGHRGKWRQARASFRCSRPSGRLHVAVVRPRRGLFVGPVVEVVLVVVVGELVMPVWSRRRGILVVILMGEVVPFLHLVVLLMMLSLPNVTGRVSILLT